MIPRPVRIPVPSAWDCQRPKPISGCDSASRRYSNHSREARTLLDLHAETHWPRGLGLLGKLVEAAILSPSEGGKELARLKRLIESNPQA